MPTVVFSAARHMAVVTTSAWNAKRYRSSGNGDHGEERGEGFPLHVEGSARWHRCLFFSSLLVIMKCSALLSCSGITFV